MAASRLPLRLWLAYWRTLQRYHRYTVQGLEHLDGPRAALIVGYHGRPFAYDMCMLTVRLYDRLGYLPHGFVHRGMRRIPVLRWMVEGLGFLTGEDEDVARAVARGQHIVVTPGGAREGCRSFRRRYRVHWGNGVGYVRLALRHRLPIVPVAAAGADGAYIGLNDAERLGRRLGLPHDWRWLPWLGLGPLGPWPLSPPFPVRMRQLVGAPIDPRSNGEIALDDRDGLLRIHARVQDAVQDLLDRARGRLAS
ncbi:MAG TPA: lysophospholipid acyltransferase family protein [Candidatus Binatia bacterium]|nr:lysophospholipid acyltransferase family protein [Candidatus Binatia bacterium]